MNETIILSISVIITLLKKQLSRGVLRKRCSENTQQIYSKFTAISIKSDGCFRLLSQASVPSRIRHAGNIAIYGIYE